MTMLLLGIALLSVLVILVSKSGGTRAAIAMLVGALCLAPYPLYKIGATGTVHYGISSGVPAITTYAVALAVGFFLLRGESSRASAPVLETVFPLFMLVGMFAFWDGNATQWSGFLQYSVAFLAIAVGRRLAVRVSTSGRIQRTFATSLLAVFSFQAVVEALQFLGLPVGVGGNLLIYLSEGRLVGTFDHPSVIGKVALLLLPVLLPLSLSDDPVVRSRVKTTIVLIVPLVAATLSRANTIAVIGAIVLWFVFDGQKRSIGSKVALLGVLVLGSVPFLGGILGRFEADPEGGDRSYLLGLGLRQIRDNPFFGTGPNYYVDTVGRSDYITSLGYPVHNTFLLAVAEIGLLLGVLFFVPFALQLGQAWTSRNAVGSASHTARAVLVAAPGLLLIAWTGWGMLSGGVLILWFFVIGYTSEMMRSAAPTVVEAEENDSKKLHGGQVGLRSGRWRSR